MKTCSCGTENESSAMFCSGCGKRLPSEQPQASAPQPQQPSVPATWRCSCGTDNNAVTMFCSGCGKRKPQPKPEPEPAQTTSAGTSTNASATTSTTTSTGTNAGTGGSSSSGGCGSTFIGLLVVLFVIFVFLEICGVNIF